MSRSKLRTSPVDAALKRLADLAGRGVGPSRMDREVEATVAGWLGGDSPADQGEMAERLAALHEQIAAGTDQAAEQLADIDSSDTVALRHAGLLHAALVGALDAIKRAQEARRTAPAAMPLAPARGPVAATIEDAPPAPAPLAANGDHAVAVPAPAEDAVTIDPLADWNPQAVDHRHPEEVRLGSQPSQAPAITEPARPQTKIRKTRKNARGKEKDLLNLSNG